VPERKSSRRGTIERLCTAKRTESASVPGATRQKAASQVPDAVLPPRAEDRENGRERDQQSPRDHGGEVGG
jgi:hypothetical protein